MAHYYRRLIVLGFSAGLRSMMPFALLARTSQSPLDGVPIPVPGGKSAFPLRALQASQAPAVCTLAALGEVVVDKLPLIPSRLNTGPLGERLVSGGFAGLTLAQQEQKNTILGFVLGSGTAALGALSGYHARRTLGQATKSPDLVWAICEDTAALVLARWATNS